MLSRQTPREAIDAANIPVLLLLLVHLTGSRHWLDEPYRPTRNPGLGDNGAGGLPGDLQSEIRQAAHDAILRWQAGEPMALHSPPEELLIEMLSASMGEPVPDEYGPMIAAELGVTDNGASDVASSPPGFEVLIIGAGISGLAAAVSLERAGIPYTIVEKNDDVGGTWLDNRYPGCGVDTPSAIYSFSFAVHDWSQHFAGRDEVLAYLQRLAVDSGARQRIHFEREVVSARYDDSRQRWTVTVLRPDGSTELVEANAIISAVGAFTRPKMPDIPGLESFAGPRVHTARWPDDVELTGRRVGVVGTGASAMQIVPAIADEAGQLTVFQRSPGWVAPFPYLHSQVPPAVRQLAREVPLYRTWYRLRWAWTFNDRLHPALQKDPDWPHPERAVNAENDAHRRFFTRYLDSEIGDRPDLREAVLPDYPPFGKRILLDNGWFRTLVRDDVELVTDPITSIHADGLECASGTTHRLDVLILATGFDVVRFLAPMDIRGRNGQRLHDVWADNDARAYLGTTVPGFPNFFILYGPNIQPGHGGSLTGLAEIQSRYIVDLLQQMFAKGIGTVECRQGIWEEYNHEVDQAHEKMIWTHPGMSTYYRNSRGRVVVPGPFRVIDLWHRMRNAQLEDYHAEQTRL